MTLYWEQEIYHLLSLVLDRSAKSRKTSSHVIISTRKRPKQSRFLYIKGPWVVITIRILSVVSEENP